MGWAETEIPPIAGSELIQNPPIIGDDLHVEKIEENSTVDDHLRS
jgi:hypothetical protein